MSEDCVSDTFDCFFTLHILWLPHVKWQDRAEYSPAITTRPTQRHIFQSVHLHPANTHTAIKELDVNAKDYSEWSAADLTQDLSLQLT